MGIQKIQNKYLVILPRFHADHTSSKNGSYFLENIFVSVGFAYDFAFWKIIGLQILKLFHEKKDLYTLRNDDLFGGGSGGSKKRSNFWIFRMSRYEKIIFSQDVSIFFLVFLKYFGDKYGE